jgi:hypothetical protein
MGTMKGVRQGSNLHAGREQPGSDETSREAKCSGDNVVV